MKFLERSYTTRSRRGREHSEANTPAETIGSGDEAMDTRKKSLPKRPSTSAGEGERSSSKGWSRARDDGKSPTCSEDLHKAGRVLEFTDGKETFRFPTPSPGKLPRSATFHHSPSRLQHKSPGIGVAIGSPSHAPPHWGRSYTADHVTTLAQHQQQQPPNRPPPPPPSQLDASSPSPKERRKKKTSWKPFGGLFRKTSKHVPEQSHPPDSQAGHESEPARCSPDLPQLLPPSGLTSPAQPSPQPMSRLQHSRTHSWSRAHRRAGSRDSAEKTSRILTKLVPKSSTSTPRRTPKLMGSVEVFQPTQDQRRDSPVEQRNVNIKPPQVPTTSTPRLLLDIPNPELERYSVMFEKLLSNDPRPSLFERRQSKLQTLKSGHGESGERLGITTSTGIPQRSMTSPYLTSRLSILVDSQKQTRSPTDRRPQPLQRSHTAPILATSPLRPFYTRNHKSTLESSPESPHSVLYSENSLPPTPCSMTTCTDTDSIKRVLEQNEPAWQMVTSHPVTILSPTSEKPELYPRVKSPEDLERQIVQVSVARQVSVSRARTRVQKAVETKQPLRPRVVEMGKNRKSTVGVLESAGDEVVEAVPVPKIERDSVKGS